METKTQQSEVISARERESPGSADASVATTVPALEAIAFTGSAKEYFAIWLSNLLLTIVTLGIYSAWAKVRRVGYFYNNTRIAGYPFNYHATGTQILKGRAMTLGVIFAANLMADFVPATGFVIGPLSLFLIPWLLNASLRFSARMTSWRNVRLNWHGTYGKTFWFLWIGPILGLMSFGILLPLIYRYAYRYFAENHSYGMTRFSASPTLRSFYWAFFLSVLPMIFLIAISFVVMQPFIVTSDAGQLQEEMAAILILSTTFMVIFYLFLFLFLLITVFDVLCRNLLLRSLALGNVARFHSTISPIRFVWIFLSNLVAILLSLGLLLPWAKVRMYRYLCACTAIGISDDLDKIIDEEQAGKSAFGEEFAEMEGVDFGI
uniref:Uncharacterized membrane protein YjgN, DUF898 family n=1 Tax=Candidatus Kentrum sp. SD TaxID=2126332 RepID=A0A450YGE5_9GAMM|nr:MAG: Uncharacterized membrane protein YjgN, DUF898 family [Candidatus Kentron sp. SD]VFK45658.1 MAG: Uncharacterized membrane protein YjgN, DUF898 family [Candidatus Kentron sp. SD]VFK79061.1 MAG: Uncharacterized membrane protein YjgN, DUF898 family [Candidatus Kentron sp. SD]